MPNLQITIAGLCTFAFNRPLKANNGPPPDEATLILQKLTNAVRLQHKIGGVEDALDQHFPVLVYNLADRIAESTRVPDFLCQPDPLRHGEMTKGVCLLFGEDLAIQPDDRPLKSKELRVSVKQPADKSKAPQNDDELASLSWIASLEDAFPDQKGKIKSVFYDFPPGTNQDILARVQLTEGRLRTLRLTEEPVVFVPVGPKSFKQLITTHLRYELTFTNKIEFVMTRRDRNGESKRSLILAPSGGGDLQIEIQNMEIDSLIGIGPAYLRKLPEADFEVYARLVNGLPAKGAVPHTHKIGPANSSGMGGSVCPPTSGVK
jgi:hypothetical protein